MRNLNYAVWQHILNCLQFSTVFDSKIIFWSVDTPDVRVEISKKDFIRIKLNNHTRNNQK